MEGGPAEGSGGVVSCELWVLQGGVGGGGLGEGVQTKLNGTNQPSFGSKEGLHQSLSRVPNNRKEKTRKKEKTKQKGLKPNPNGSNQTPMDQTKPPLV